MHILQFRVLSKFRYKTQSNRFDRISAVSADRRLAVHCRSRHVGKGIHLGDAFDRIDCRNSICPASFCGFRKRTHLCDIRGQLGEDRFGCTSSCGSGKAFRKFFILADIRTESPLFHIRTGEIQFDRIRAVFIAEPGKLLPFVFVASHDRRKDKLRRIVLLQLPEDLHILFYRVVGKLFNIFKPDDRTAVSPDRRKARGRFMDIKGADCLEGNTAPSRLKGTGAHVIGACDNTGRKQKRILHRNPAEITSQTFFILGDRTFIIRQDFFLQPDHQFADRHFPCPYTGSFTRRITIHARQCIRQRRCRRCLITKPDTAEYR